CVRARTLRGDRDRPLAARSGRFPLAHAGADRRGPLVDLARGRPDPVQGRGVGVDAARRPAAAGLGRSGAAEPRLRAARHAGPLPAAARGRPGGLPVRAHGQRARDPRLRGDRDAACALLPEPDLLSIRRLLWLGAGLWVGRWAVLEAASWLERTRASGPPANASGRPPARMPGPDA